MGKFHASVQYGDWTGEVTADNADHTTPIRDFEDYLQEKGLLAEGKQIVGIDAFYHHEHHPEAKPFSVRVLVIEAKTFEEVARAVESPEMLREVEVISDNAGDKLWFTVEEFFHFFKRFSIVLQRKGVDAIGKDFPSYNP
jgi:hypothetical protein